MPFICPTKQNKPSSPLATAFPASAPRANRTVSDFTVPKENLKLTRGADTLKTFVRKGDSGKSVPYRFCGECPGTVTVDAELYAGVYILKWGNLDDRDLLDSWYPQVEIYSRFRFGKIAPYPHCAQEQ